MEILYTNYLGENKIIYTYTSVCVYTALTSIGTS